MYEQRRCVREAIDSTIMGLVYYSKGLDWGINLVGIAGSSKGRTTVFGAVYLGSNPSPAATFLQIGAFLRAFVRFADALSSKMPLFDNSEVGYYHYR